MQEISSLFILFLELSPSKGADTQRWYRLQCGPHHAENLLFPHAHETCFLFAAGSPRAWFKFGWLGNTCGLEVRFVKTIHPLFLTYTSVLQAFAKHTVTVMWCRKDLCGHDVAFCCGQNNGLEFMAQNSFRTQENRLHEQWIYACGWSRNISCFINAEIKSYAV